MGHTDDRLREVQDQGQDRYEKIDDERQELQEKRKDHREKTRERIHSSDSLILAFPSIGFS